MADTISDPLDLSPRNTGDQGEGGAVVDLAAADGFVVQAWREPPREARRGGLVVLHAIWSVTPHLRALAAEWAGEGWEVLVPSLFDRAAPGFAIADADPALFEQRSALAAATGWGDAVTPDVQAAVDALAPSGPVCVMGFCFGGTAAWLAACRCEGVAASAAFYGGRIIDFVGETPRSPILLHFGRLDALTPAADVERIREAHPDTPVHVYEAGHAFVAPSGYEADSARLAMLRTRAFFHRAVGGREHGA